jgi:DNA-binding MarR family transcriptional regulator
MSMSSAAKMSRVTGAKSRAKTKRGPAKGTAREKVEQIFKQWQTERPDINPDPVRIYGLIGRIQTEATACIDEVLAPFKLVRGTFDVLTALRRAGGPYCLSPKELAQFLLMSGAGLNSRLNKLERLHYIARLPEPADRRSLRIQLTVAGEAAINDAIPRVFEVQWKLLSALSNEDRSALAEGLARFADTINSYTSNK